LVFLILAAWLHLCLFLFLERIGLENFAPPPIQEDVFSSPVELLELELELNPSARVEDEAPAQLVPEELTVEDGPIPVPSDEIQSVPIVEEIIPDPLEAMGALELDAAPERALSPEELLDPLDNQVKTFSFSNNSPLIGEEDPSGTVDNTINVEESAPRLKSYDSQVRTAVARHWILPPSARTNFQPGRFSASMTINNRGDILSIVVKESAGSTTLDYAAIEALRGAAPYPPFPDELSQVNQRTFLMNFDYRAVIRNSGTPQKQ
jgi:protein TonB